MDPSASPFVVFTIIAAPAMLTNAASVMSLATSNRVARAIDRSRSIMADLAGKPEAERRRKVRQIELLRERAMILTRALGWYQLDIGAFASATLVALVGTVLHYLEPHYLGRVGFGLSLLCAVLGVSAVAVASWRIVQEIWLSYALLREDTADVMSSLRSPILTHPSDAGDHSPEAPPR